MIFRSVVASRIATAFNLLSVGLVSLWIQGQDGLVSGAIINISSNNACIRYSTFPVTWHQVSHACEEDGIPLVMTENTAESPFNATSHASASVCESNIESEPDSTAMLNWCDYPYAPLSPSLGNLFLSELNHPGFRQSVWTGLGPDLKYTPCAFGFGTDFPYSGALCSGSRKVLCLYEVVSPTVTPTNAPTSAVVPTSQPTVIQTAGPTPFPTTPNVPDEEDEYVELWNNSPSAAPTSSETLGPIGSSAGGGIMNSRDMSLIIGAILFVIGLCIGIACWRDPVRRRSLSRRLSGAIPTADEIFTFSNRVSGLAAKPIRNRSFSGRTTSTTVNDDDGRVIAHYEVNPVLGTHVYTSAVGMEQNMHRASDYNYGEVLGYPAVPASTLRLPSDTPISKRIGASNKHVTFLVTHDGNVPESV